MPGDGTPQNAHRLAVALECLTKFVEAQVIYGNVLL